MSEQVTVGYDGSPSSAQAVGWAAGEAAARSVPLRIVCCYDLAPIGASIPAFPATGAVASMLEAADTNCRSISRVVTTAHPSLKVTSEVSPGPASAVLLHGVEPGDLVVVGANSHEDSFGMWLARTPAHLVRHSPCPVVVVRDTPPARPPSRVVVGVDESPAFDPVVRWAAEEADRHDVDLVVVHGWWYPYVVSETFTAQARELTEIDAMCTLDRALELARDQCRGTVTGCLVEDSPAAAILEGVRDGDLLVLGSRGRRAIVAGFFGSTVNSVLDQCAVPVVVIPNGATTTR